MVETARPMSSVNRLADPFAQQRFGDLRERHPDSDVETLDKSMMRLPHFCECSAGCAEVVTPGTRFCESHRDEYLSLADTFIEAGCPRCGLPAPDGMHLHRCSGWGRPRRALSRRHSGAMNA